MSHTKSTPTPRTPGDIELGWQVRDLVTGFTGIAVARVEYLNGCVQYCVKPQAGEDGKMPEGEYIDAGQLEIVGPGVSVQRRETGGPMRDTPPTRYRG